MKQSDTSQSGFSLLELLVVIAVIAVLIGLAVPNYMGARQRARDVSRKENLRQLKNALRLYYNDYSQYPPAGSPLPYVQGCGDDGLKACYGGSNQCGEGVFAAGGTGCDTVYMRKLPYVSSAVSYKYFRCASGDDFRLTTDLENVSDADITSSQSRCPVGCGKASYSTQEYVMCAD